ncbi:MAG: polymerase [Pseudonocardiales bacterium]|nr:polymerase [Pseudonocardiales bacterium]
MTEPVVRTASELLARLRAAGVGRGGSVALALVDGVGLGVAADGGRWSLAGPEPAAVVALLESEIRPRWVWWSQETPSALIAAGLRLATCWDLGAVHRLLFGGWRSGPSLVWAALHDLAEESIPGMGQLNLLSQGGDEGTDPEDPLRPDGHLRPEWVSGGWARDPERWARWAATALAASACQRDRLAALRVAGDAGATARSESAVELLCAELAADGLPVDRRRAEDLLATLMGPRPRDESEASSLQRRRDDTVRGLLADGDGIDLRNPAQVKRMLVEIGVDVPDTRAWRLEALTGAHPVIPALLAWRKSERIATTYGYRWLDEHVGADGRLRGRWSSSDGAAGRMTAQAGLHNLPAELRPAVVAEPGHVLVRADLGQIEPRVLAAVSKDRALAGATADDDLYSPVAARLGVERPVAKVAVLAAMYGQTSGAAGEALRGLESAYPTAMRFLRKASEEGRAGRDVRTYGGRLVRIGALPPGLDENARRTVASGRGRFARNAVIQGAAAELFKVWAVTVRARAAALDARIVLCLHDELLLHVPAEHGGAAANLLHECLAGTARLWFHDAGVRFVADVSVIQQWSEAKS